MVLPIEHQLSMSLSGEGFYEDLLYHFMRPMTADCISDVYDGFQYQKLVHNGGVLSDQNSLSLKVNTDGVPIFKSSGYSMWPIYFEINELALRIRLTPIGNGVFRMVAASKCALARNVKAKLVKVLGEIPFGTIKGFCRIKIGRQVFHSKAYSRVSLRNSYSCGIHRGGGSARILWSDSILLAPSTTLYASAIKFLSAMQGNAFCSDMQIGTRANCSVC